MTTDVQRRRYSLLLPGELYERLKNKADEEDISVVELLKRFIKLGLLVMDIERDEKSAFLIQTGEKIERIRFL